MKHESSLRRSAVSRRGFVQGVAGAAVLGLTGRSLASGLFADGGPGRDSVAETAVREFYKTLSDAQKGQICLPFNDGLRNRINPNWHVTKPQIGEDFFTQQQRSIITEIVRNTCSEDGYARLEKQMEEDSGGIDYYSVAVFGDPESDQFEFELTGRHLTLRADGNSVQGAAFGGPIVYGHGEEDPKLNLFHYQTQKANEVFKSLDADQAEKALLRRIPKETDVAVQGADGRFAGISIADLSADQLELFEQTLKTLLAPYRQEDIDEVIAIIKATGGLKAMKMAFYRQGDLNEDGVWDNWRIEGPSMVCHFRGAPHVHAYINVMQKS